MGSSTRNSYDRSKRIIDKNIEEGKIEPTSEGIAKLLVDLLFPKNGVSKTRITLQKNLYSQEYTEGLTKIFRVHKAVRTGELEKIGLGGLFDFPKIEQKEKICDYIGINDNELLKISFNETFDKHNLFDEQTSFLEFASTFTKNIMSNVFRQYTYEDALNALPGFNTNIYNNDLEGYMEAEVLPIINIEMEELDFEELEQEEDRSNIVEKVINTISNILNRLKRKKE